LPGSGGNLLLERIHLSLIFFAAFIPGPWVLLAFRSRARLAPSSWPPSNLGTANNYLATSRRLCTAD
jgi:hypothetical protein